MKKIIVITWFLMINIYPQTSQLIGPPGGVAYHIKIHPDNPKIVYCISGNGSVFMKDENDEVHPVSTIDYGHRASITLPLKQTDYIYTGTFWNFRMSSDRGRTWKTVPSKGHVKIACNPINSDIIYLTLNNNELWRSNDKGINISRVKVFEKEIRYIAIAPSDTSMIYLVHSNELYRSSNSGKDWNKRCTLPYDVLQMFINPLNENSVYCNLATKIYKLEYGGTVIRDLGINKISSFVMDPQDTLTFYAAGRPEVLPVSGTIMKTLDEGKYWFPMDGGLEQYNAYGISIAINPKNPLELYAGIENLGVFRTLDGGRSWKLTNLCNSEVKDFSFDCDNPQNITASLEGWKILQTSDGVNWEKPNFDPPETYYIITVPDFSFNPFDRSQGFLCTGNTIYKTSDHGKNYFKAADIWFPYEINYHAFLNGTIFLKAGATYSFMYYVSSNNGMDWIIKYTGLKDEHVFNKRNPEVIYQYSTFDIRKTTDMCAAWESKLEGLYRDNDGVSYISAVDVDPDNPDIVYCSQAQGLSKSTDGGNTWFRIDSELRKAASHTGIRSICLDPRYQGRMFLGTSNGLLLLEEDGKKWKRVFDKPINKIKLDTINNFIYLSTQFGIIRLVDTFKVATDVRNYESAQKKDFHLLGNFPNPFNPSTTIEYFLPELSYVQIEIYDITGTLIRTLKNDYGSIGANYTEWDGRNSVGQEAASGIYLYIVRAKSKTGESVYKKANKMIILR